MNATQIIKHIKNFDNYNYNNNNNHVSKITLLEIFIRQLNSKLSLENVAELLECYTDVCSGSIENVKMHIFNVLFPHIDCVAPDHLCDVLRAIQKLPDRLEVLRLLMAKLKPISPGFVTNILDLFDTRGNYIFGTTIDHYKVSALNIMQVLIESTNIGDLWEVMQQFKTTTVTYFAVELYAKNLNPNTRVNSSDVSQLLTVHMLDAKRIKEILNIMQAKNLLIDTPAT